MANTTEAYCENCECETTHFFYSDGWECDECGSTGNNIYKSPFDKD